jgi:GNAT superfamily N-acetyltransferase
MDREPTQTSRRPHDGDGELRRRAIDGVRAEVEAFGSGAAGSRVVRHEGLVAAIAPSSPDRSLFNAVFYDDDAALAGAIDELASEYERSGVRAWAVWVPDEDRATAALLEARGHVLDSAPRAMALWLDDLAPAPNAPADTTEIDADAPTAARLNDRAYGYDGAAFGTALPGQSDPPLRWAFVARDGEPVACLATIDLGDDCCVTGVATLPEHRRRGIAGWLLQRVLARARERGMRSASLQAAKAGAGVYRSLGFRDLGFLELWERRSTPSGPARSPRRT